jgi:hypothetical protein
MEDWHLSSKLTFENFLKVSFGLRIRLGAFVGIDSCSLEIR